MKLQFRNSGLHLTAVGECMIPKEEVIFCLINKRIKKRLIAYVLKIEESNALLITNPSTTTSIPNYITIVNQYN